MTEEVCQNCGHKISGGETAYVYKSNIVCRICYRELVRQVADMNFDTFDPPDPFVDDPD